MESGLKDLSRAAKSNATGAHCRLKGRRAGSRRTPWNQGGKVRVFLSPKFVSFTATLLQYSVHQHDYLSHVIIASMLPLYLCL